MQVLGCGPSLDIGHVGNVGIKSGIVEASCKEREDGDVVRYGFLAGCAVHTVHSRWVDEIYSRFELTLPAYAFMVAGLYVPYSLFKATRWNWAYRKT
jgi:hypothetical protein